jgi:hypothetical protein
MDVSFCVLYSPAAAIDEDTTSPLCLREWQYLYEGSRCPRSAEELAAKPADFCRSCGTPTDHGDRRSAS